MYKEKIVIWANENSSYFDDLNERLKNVSFLKNKLSNLTINY